MSTAILNMVISQREFPTDRQKSGLQQIRFPTLTEFLPVLGNMITTLQFILRIAAMSMSERQAETFFWFFLKRVVGLIKIHTGVHPKAGCW
jgi:hypothetical protein